MATRISDGNVKSSLTGTEKIPVSGASTPVVTIDQIKSFTLRESFEITSAEPSVGVTWIDSGNAYAGMYPVRRYINGVWQSIFPSMDYYDPIGNVISKGRPLCILVWGQSNTASNFYADYLDTTTGDVTKDNYITLRNYDASTWVIPDYAAQPSGGTSNNWSWNLNNFGTNNIQVFAKKFVKKYNRSVRVVMWRQGGTGLAYWEPGGVGGGGAGYLNLVAAATASGVPYFDLIIGCQGESGLVDPSHASLYTTWKESLYKGIMTGLRSQNWADSKTAFLMPSVANGLMFWPVGESDEAEYGIRSLNDGTNPYNGWGQGNHVKGIQIPVSPVANTSTTSVNMTTATYPVTITIPTIYGALSGNVVVISRSNPNNYFVGDVTSYDSGTGVTVIGAEVYPSGHNNFNGSGASTDWDFLPQDYLHKSTWDNINDGNALFEAYENLGFTKKVNTVQDTDSDNNLKGTRTQYPIGDDLQLFFNHITTNGNIRTENFITSVGGKIAANKIFVDSDGDWIYAASADGASEATIADKGITFSDFGTLISKALFAYYSAAAVLQTKFEIDSDGSLGWRYQSASGGDANGSHRFDFGNKSALYLKENGGLPKLTFGRGFQSSLNSTQKTEHGVENRVGLFSSSLSAGASLTSTIFSNDPITEIAPYTVIRIEVIVQGLTNDATHYFDARKWALFTIEGYGVVTKVDEAAAAVISGTATAVASLSFSVVSGQISATLVRGVDIGDYKVSSVQVVTKTTF